MLYFFLALLSSLTLSAQDLSGQDFKGYIEINDRKIWVDYKAPKNGAPLVALMNGMTYSTDQWATFSKAFRERTPDTGLLKYDMRGQGRTLAPIPNHQALYVEFDKLSRAFFKIHDYTNPQEYFEKLISGELALDTFEYFEAFYRLWDLSAEMSFANATEDIYATDQSSDFNELIQIFSGSSEVHIVGLSYGGAIGMQYLSEHPDKVESLTLMAPFVAKLRKQDEWVKIQMQIARTFNPYLYFVPDDDLYRFFFRILVYGTFPVAEPIVLENSLKIEASYRLAIGLKEFNALDITPSFPDRKVHLMVSLQDEYVEKEVLDELWNELKSSQASRVNMQNAKHKIPEDVPQFAAEWVSRIVAKDPELQDGKTFEKTIDTTGL